MRALIPSHKQDKFEGKLIHSSQHGSAREHKGKKVVVIGACTSGHDIAHDHYTHGVGKLSNTRFHAIIDFLYKM